MSDDSYDPLDVDVVYCDACHCECGSSDDDILELCLDCDQYLCPECLGGEHEIDGELCPSCVVRDVKVVR